MMQVRAVGAIQAGYRPILRKSVVYNVNGFFVSDDVIVLIRALDFAPQWVTNSLCCSYKEDPVE